MISLNKVLMVVVCMSSIITAEEIHEPKFSEQVKTTASELKKSFDKATSQENIDWAKDCINQGLEQTEKIFKQYPMYIPAVFCLGRATHAAKMAGKKQLPQELSKGLIKAGKRNFAMSVALIVGHVYYNRDVKPVNVSVENTKENVLPKEQHA